MTGQGQAEASNPDQSPYGTERLAVSGSGHVEVKNTGWCDKVQNGRQAGSGSGQAEWSKPEN